MDGWSEKRLFDLSEHEHYNNVKIGMGWDDPVEPGICQVLVSQQRQHNISTPTTTLSKLQTRPVQVHISPPSCLRLTRLSWTFFS